jgi:two-component system CheB/CheR fusion protein
MHCAARKFSAIILGLGLGAAWVLGQAGAGQRPVLFLGNEALPPINFMHDGHPDGAVVDLARALARHMRRPVAIRLMNWAQAQQLVQEGQADALLQANPSPERQAVYDFSQPLLTSEFFIFTAPRLSGISSIQGLEGLKVGVEAMGLPLLLLRADPRITLEVIPDITAGFGMVSSGGLDAVVADRWVGSYLLAQNGIHGITLSGGPISRSQSAIAVRKGDAVLLRDIDDALAAIHRDGTYDRIIAAWRSKEVVFRTREQVHRQAWLVAWVSLALALSLGGIVVLAREVRRRRRAEAALRATDLRRTEFLAVLSHELRNPLAPIRYSLYILDHAAHGSEQALRAKDVIDRQTRQLARLIDDLLDVTRITRDKIQPRRERLDLVELTLRTVGDHREVFRERAVALETELAQGPLWVDGDRTRLAQVIGNLLHNAAKFTPPGGKAVVTLQAQAAAGMAVLTVADNGCGIEPGQIARLFEAFAQADRTLDRSAGGLGLGLALVKGLAELHGGSASCASEGPGKGSRFTVRLPLEPPCGAVRFDGAGARRSVAPRRMLIVEDLPDAGNSLRDVLECEGHAVAIARDGAEGLEQAARFKPEVVLCDLGLPVMDGFALARALRADPRFSQIRLIALSGYTQPEDRRKARAAGFDAHLAKPLDLEELGRILEEVPAS